MLNLKSVTKDYITSSEVVRALRGVSIAFRKNEFVSILGPSGCGKTTLLNIIGGLDHYTNGDLLIAGKSTKSFKDRDWDVYRNHRIGFIFQSYNLIPHQTVLGNVELALTIAGVSKEERIVRAKRALDRVGLKDQYYKRPNQLSGGQCQRVAIARALVNDPEILLADEPTGALDTVTSVQIMELIREISSERLVIMVTHNPELAEKYSSRIIKLRDGQVIEDSNPFDAADEEAECREIARAVSDAEAERLAEIEKLEKKEKKKAIKAGKKKKERAKMSFFTAFMLSARNLISKKGRTAMVGFAGSIGIIGIAMVLAFSAGINGYIDSMQDDMLSGNPIQITETGYDSDAIMGMMSLTEKVEVLNKLDGHVYVSSLVEYFVKMQKDVSEIVMENELTKEYINYVEAMPKEIYNAMLLEYGIDLSPNIYTNFKYSGDEAGENVSVKNIVDVYTSVLQGTEFANLSQAIGTFTPSFQQAPDNAEYLYTQYDMVSEGSKIATEKNEIMLVLNSDDELSDLLLAMLGYFTQEEFEEIIHKANTPDGEEYKDTGIYKNAFTYEQLLGKEFTWYPNNTIFTKQTLPAPLSGTTYSYNHKSDEFSQDGAVQLKIVGILKTKDNVNYGALKSGIYYTEALTNHILETNKDSEIIQTLLNNEDDLMKASYYYIMYSYSYTGWDGVRHEQGTADAGRGTISPAVSMTDIMSNAIGSGMGGAGGSGGQGGSNTSMLDTEKLKERLIRQLGGNDLANEIYIYPINFDEKVHVTEYLDAWNEAKGDLTYGDVTIAEEDRNDITYTDTLELVITMIRTMIQVVTYALVAFTSISLVVSTVMIGIITYVSVVERIKEIGVIRSLGGRKKDVSHLFNAETFIIGLLAGLFGVGVTYLVSLFVNIILGPIINYSAIAALPISSAVVLVLLSVGLTLISGLIPASSAAKKDPVVALRTE